MNIDFEQLIVALVMLGPGFVVTWIQSELAPKRFESPFSRLVVSFLWGLTLNIPVLLAALWILGLWNKTVKEVGESVGDQSWLVPLTYVFAVYLLGAIVGGVSVLSEKTTLRHWADQFGLTGMTTAESVWKGVLDRQRPSDRPTIWLNIYINAENALVGHLRHGSTFVEQDKPIELYLTEAHWYRDGEWSSVTADGVYFKLTQEHFVEMYFLAEGECLGP